MPNYLTQTFVENQYYHRQAGPSPGGWTRVNLPMAEGQKELPLDTQIKNWVKSTGAEIVHPGQPGIHKQWYDDGSLLCVTIGLTILYVEQKVPLLHDYADPVPEPFTGTD